MSVKSLTPEPTMIGSTVTVIAKVAEVGELGVEQRRFQFISDTRGGSAFLLAGAAFWLVGAVVTLVWPGVGVQWVLYAGLSVPILGVAIGRAQGVKFSSHPTYATLAGLATVTELAALPTMFFLRESFPGALPGILLIADGARLMIMMCLHLDYTYFLAANAKIVLGVLFVFGLLWPGSYPLQLGAAGLVSLIAVPFVWRDSGRTIHLYLRT